MKKIRPRAVVPRQLYAAWCNTTVRPPPPSHVDGPHRWIVSVGPLTAVFAPAKLRRNLSSSCRTASRLDSLNAAAAVPLGSVSTWRNPTAPAPGRTPVAAGLTLLGRAGGRLVRACRVRPRQSPPKSRWQGLIKREPRSAGGRCRPLRDGPARLRVHVGGRSRLLLKRAREATGLGEPAGVSRCRRCWHRRGLCRAVGHACWPAAAF